MPAEHISTKAGAIPVIGLGIFTRLGRRHLNRRRDRTPAVLRKLARAETNARLARRLLPIANALSGLSRKEAAEAARHGPPGLKGLRDPLQRAWPGRAL